MNAPTSTAQLIPEFHPREVPAVLIEALKARFGERCSTALVVREQHGRDESSFTVPPPAAVVFAESTDDVAQAVRLAAAIFLFDVRPYLRNRFLRLGYFGLNCVFVYLVILYAFVAWRGGLL